MKALKIIKTFYFTNTRFSWNFGAVLSTLGPFQFFFFNFRTVHLDVFKCFYFNTNDYLERAGSEYTIISSEQSLKDEISKFGNACPGRNFCQTLLLRCDVKTCFKVVNRPKVSPSKHISRRHSYFRNLHIGFTPVPQNGTPSICPRKWDI